MRSAMLRTFHQDEFVTLSDFISKNEENGEDKEFQCKVLELPWRDNKPQISCIPAGEYKVNWTKSPRFGIFTYEIFNVPGRGGIRIHKGNTIEHTLGCPLPGKQILKIKEQPFVNLSGPTLMEMENFFERKSFKLFIIRKEK